MKSGADGGDSMLLTISCHLHQRRLGLGQPEGHVHSAVQRDGSGQFSAGLLPLTSRGVQGAEAEVTVGLERTHAEILGQGKGLAVVGFSRLDIRGVAMNGDAAEQSPGIRLVALLLLGLGDVTCPGRVLHGVLQATRQQ